MRSPFWLFLACLFFCALTWARPPHHPPQWNTFHSHRWHHHAHAHRISPWQAWGIGLGIGSLWWRAEPVSRPIAASPIYVTAPPVVYLPQPPVYAAPVVIEKSPTQLFCRSQNEFFPKVPSCAEGWLEVLNPQK